MNRATHTHTHTRANRPIMRKGETRRRWVILYILCYFNTWQPQIYRHKSYTHAHQHKTNTHEHTDTDQPYSLTYTHIQTRQHTHKYIHTSTPSTIRHSIYNCIVMTTQTPSPNSPVPSAISGIIADHASRSKAAGPIRPHLTDPRAPRGVVVVVVAPSGARGPTCVTVCRRLTARPLGGPDGRCQNFDVWCCNPMFFPRPIPRPTPHPA